MPLEIYASILLIVVCVIYSKRKEFLNFYDKNTYISNTNLLYKRAKETLLEKNVVKKGNQIYIYEINSLKRNGKLIKILEINKIPIKIKTKNKIKYSKVPLKIEIQQDLKK
ncbi:hypothetical protein [Acinetobacter bereziniae]|uniref:hypothetical protein n=1 Tax=Acinetobacter bereziniae TaxID=106648 RepID=UPI001250653D|nr:hypothetical protein [Acinetobacter bereziniae]